MDLVLVGFGVIWLISRSIYKGMLSLRYRDDPHKWEAVMWNCQRHPPWLMKFVLDEDDAPKPAAQTTP